MGDDNHEFQVFLKPVAARCNLRCSYCYYLEHEYHGSVSAGLKMSDEILGEYIRHHLTASDGKNVFFSWHGGEPTLAGISFFRRVIELQKRFAPPGCNILNGMQTNATLIDEEWGGFLKENGFYMGVSLDGPELFHNNHRRRADGRGSFDDVMRGLSILRSHGVPNEILCVVNSENVRAPLEVYRFFRELGVEFITFLPLVERAATGSHLTGSRRTATGYSVRDHSNPPAESDAKQAGEIPDMVTSRSVKPGDFGRFLSLIFDEWIAEDIGRIKVQVFEEALRSAFGQEHTLCIFKPVCGMVPVVEINGDFYSCDHYVNDDHRIGNIMHRSLSSLLDDPRQKAFGEAKKKTLTRYCLECEVLEMCNGECPKNRFITTPDGEPGLNYLCEGYRQFFNHCRPFIDEVARVWRTGQ